MAQVWSLVDELRYHKLYRMAYLTPPPPPQKKTKMPTLATLFNIELEILKKKLKGIRIEKEEVKLSLFADGMILYI